MLECHLSCAYISDSLYIVKHFVLTQGRQYWSLHAKLQKTTQHYLNMVSVDDVLNRQRRKVIADSRAVLI